MPSSRRIYTLEPGQEIRIEIEQPDGARALVVGTVDSVPLSIWRGQVLKAKVVDARASALPPRTTK
jgi:hypothetical protein